MGSCILPWSIFRMNLFIFTKGLSFVGANIWRKLFRFLNVLRIQFSFELGPYKLIKIYFINLYLLVIAILRVFRQLIINRLQMKKYLTKLFLILIPILLTYSMVEEIREEYNHPRVYKNIYRRSIQKGQQRNISRRPTITIVIISKFLKNFHFVSFIAS